MFVPLIGHWHTTTSTFFPATVKHKAYLRSCHRKRPISREQVPFLFSKTIPMACRAISCSLGSFHHLKHLAALQHAAAARWEPTVPLLSWATHLWAFPAMSLANTKENHCLPSFAFVGYPNSVHYSGSAVTIDEIIFNCTIFSKSCLCSIIHLFGLWIPWWTLSSAETAVPNQETIFVNIWCDCSKVLFSSTAVAISQWNKDPFYIPWETWVEWLMLC